MAVIIKGIEMPIICCECPCFDDGWFCKLDDECRKVYDGIPEWCPLVELPTSCATCKHVYNYDEPCSGCIDFDEWAPSWEGEQ